MWQMTSGESFVKMIMQLVFFEKIGDDPEARISCVYEYRMNLSSIKSNYRSVIFVYLKNVMILKPVFIYISIFKSSDHNDNFDTIKWIDCQYNNNKLFLLLKTFW